MHCLGVGTAHGTGWAYNLVMDWIYLDNNATTQPAPQVVEAMTDAADRLWANPSSVHRFGQMVKQKMELARSSLAKLIGCADSELVLTSGGTEANNLALWGLLGPGTPAAKGKQGITRRVLVTTRTEHAAVREPAEALAEHGIDVIWLEVGEDGIVDPQQLSSVLEEVCDRQTLALVSIHWANNETGVIQPVAELAGQIEALRKEPEAGRRIVFHVDGTQAVGKLPVDVKSAGVDLMTWAAHKFHGPKGVGGLYVRRGLRLRAQNLGGPQEREKRGGTENTTGIIGAGVAAELAMQFLADPASAEQLARWRNAFEQKILASIHGDQVGESEGRAQINAAGAPRLWNTTNIGFRSVEAEALLLLLSEQGVCASAGAACSSGSLEPSPVLRAMGIDEAIAHGSIRFSMSRNTTQAELDRALEVVVRSVEKLSGTIPV